MRVINKILAVDQATDADFTSQYQQLRSIYTYTIQAVFINDPTGSIKLQASADPETNDTQTNDTGLSPAVGPQNWVDIANSSFSITEEGNVMWNVNYAGYNYVRVAYTDESSGSSEATVTITFNGKGV